MNTYFKVIDDIQASLINEPFVNTVTQGDIYNVDLSKQTIFPLAHIHINGMDIQPQFITLNISILFMDIIDFSKTAPSSDIRGNNNEMDILNNMLNVATRLQALIAKSPNYKDTYELASSLSCSPFVERFENNLGGVSCDFTVNVFNTMTSC
jgi:hypothetical protein|tara:strand:- start:10298 stop:10753 length:456 start_codon:yes stop_codon:yes gene_type:complete